VKSKTKGELAILVETRNQQFVVHQPETWSFSYLGMFKT
jgi:hypothetical protein